MNKVFVDTAAWLALINSRDALHSQSIQVRERLQKEKAFLITTDFVLLELADALSSSKIRKKTIAYIQQIKQVNRLTVLPVSNELFQKGWLLYCKRLDQDWGLTDCISFVVMAQEDINVAFTSDRHFQQAGFQRLLDPKL